MPIDKYKPFEEMTTEEMEEVNRRVRTEPAKNKGKHPYSVPGIRLHGYLPAKGKQNFDMCMDFAWKSGWLKRKNQYYFVTWCVESVLASIREEMRHNPRFSPLKDNLD